MVHGGRPHVWLVEIDGKPPRQLTYSPPGADKNTKYRGEESGQWMPDGNSILFRAHRGEQTQLFRLPMNGGEALAFDLKVLPTIDNSTLPDALPPRAETKPDQAPQNPEPLPINVSGFKIAPDGKTIAIWAEDPKTPGEKKQEDEKADAVWVDHDRHSRKLKELKRQHRVIVKEDLAGAIDLANLLIVAVRPESIRELLNEIGELQFRRRLTAVSLAAGIPLSRLQARLGLPVRWVRAMIWKCRR